MRLYNKQAEADNRLKNRELIKGRYDFKFGPLTQSMKDKLEKISGEPIAFHLYKRRDLEQKIDKLAIESLRMA